MVSCFLSTKKIKILEYFFLSMTREINLSYQMGLFAILCHCVILSNCVILDLHCNLLQEVQALHLERIFARKRKNAFNGSLRMIRVLIELEITRISSLTKDIVLELS